MTEERIAVSIYPKKSLLAFIDQEAKKADRNRTKQIEYYLDRIFQIANKKK